MFFFDLSATEFGCAKIVMKQYVLFLCYSFKKCPKTQSHTYLKHVYCHFIAIWSTLVRGKFIQLIKRYYKLLLFLKTRQRFFFSQISPETSSKNCDDSRFSGRRKTSVSYSKKRTAICVMKLQFFTNLKCVFTCIIS